MWTALLDKGLTIFLTGSVLAFIEFLIRRHDEKIDKKDGVKAKLEILEAEVKEKFKKTEKDALRTQLLLLILLRPQEQQEILTIGERYFNKLKANWYMTGIFKRWCDENSLEPEWFENKE